MENKDKHPLQGILGVVNYHGCLVTPLVGGFSIFNKKVRTIEEVDDLIKDAQQSIKNSIRKAQDG